MPQNDVLAIKIRLLDHKTKFVNFYPKRSRDMRKLRELGQNDPEDGLARLRLHWAGILIVARSDSVGALNRRARELSTQFPIPHARRGKIPCARTKYLL